MNQEKIWLEFSALPPQAQRLVVEFIAFLKKYYAQGQPAPAAPQPDLADDPFIGMWRDRDDMQDSVAWTRNRRQQEWFSGR
jgi:hypothetical protein